MDLPSIDMENALTKQLDRLAALEAENAQLKTRIAALEALQPPEPKLLTEADMKIYGRKRPTLSLPEADWLPSWQQCANLANIVAIHYPGLVIRSDAWVMQFRLGMLALGHFGRTLQPNRRDWGSWIGTWLEDHRHFDGLERGPFLAAIAASGIPFTGFADADPIRGVLPAAGIAAQNTGIPPDRSAWKRVLSENRLIGETAAQQVTQGRPSRWDNPRSRVELQPQYDR